MIGLLKEQTPRLLAELAFQIVPPTILAGLAAHELSERTAFSFSEAAGLVTAVLLICIMVNSVRD